MKLSAWEGAIVMAERGNTTHGLTLDKQMKQEPREVRKGEEPAR